MFGSNLFRSLLAALLALCLCAPAEAARIAAATPAQAQAALLFPLEIIKKRDLDFGYLAAPAAGTAVIDPVTDTITKTGGVLLLGGSPHAAMFTGAAKSTNVV